MMLVAADYVLFVQANIATGRTGARISASTSRNRA